jgi:hypothetical protein
MTLNVLTAGSASAAPPVGCYGFPSIPDAFVCVTEFTPGSAVPSAGLDQTGSTVTVPAFCAGDCFGPFPVPVPAVALVPGSGRVMVVTYDGGTYAIVVGQVPSLPGGGGGECPGNAFIGTDSLQPVVCAGIEYDYWGDTVEYWTFGTCLTAPCTVVRVPLAAVQAAYDRVMGIVPD